MVRHIKTQKIYTLVEKGAKFSVVLDKNKKQLTVLTAHLVPFVETKTSKVETPTQPVEQPEVKSLEDPSAQMSSEVEKEDTENQEPKQKRSRRKSTRG